MKFSTAILTLGLTTTAYAADECVVDAGARFDCNVMDEAGCEAAGCCWGPLQVAGPWCFYKAGYSPAPTPAPTPCFVFQNSTEVSPFSDAEVATFRELFEANINMEQSGAVVAAPDLNTPGGSYYFHWMRDGALSMRAFEETTTDRSHVKEYMEQYTKWVIGRQAMAPVNDIDVRIEPKFMIPDGAVFDGGWCRPQNDGPGLRAIALTIFANELLAAGDKDFVAQNLWTTGSLNGGAIKYDLDWVVTGWDSSTCDLWEEIRSTDLFWNRLTMKKALLMGADLATTMGDATSAATYTATAAKIDDALASHWNGNYVLSEVGGDRPRDGSLFVGFNSGFNEADARYSPISVEVASTVNELNIAFCAEYKINQVDQDSEIPGILIGRYPGDGYAGGNPWVLTTAALGQLLYRAASYTLAHGAPTADALYQYSQALAVEFPADVAGIAEVFAAAGDSVMLRIKEHTAAEGGHLSEQIDRNTGVQLSAEDLTWSYAEVISAMHQRDIYMAAK